MHYKGLSILIGLIISLFVIFVLIDLLHNKLIYLFPI
jgi:hypothetical protein